ncbi:HAMP domain-containing sensor histidine kinase [Nocardioides sp. CER19]|uniref:sensor histidine kinase n=1 Tax=Nocardioides sp. CER19 TaxID=3038538 RepID=UPI0024491045|nr:HAMP domain-containing sensor histidine kinase [Nocardioides sp. CER19]MDH2414361.1 HAMP domain-containing sensor histidine kinase [Nocardioides sp. CER19]
MSVDPRAPELVSGDFVAMMSAVQLCVLVHDAETKNILWANPAACALLEWDVSELRPLKANDMSSSAQQYDRVLGRAWLQDAVDHGVSRIEWHYRSRSGRIVPTDAIATRVELAQGPAVMVQFRDIEREQHIAQELRLATSYIDALARQTSTAALMADHAGVLHFATDSAMALIGADLHQPLGALERHARLRMDGAVAGWDEVVAAAVPVTWIQLEVRGPAGVAWLEGSVERLNDTEGGTFLLLLHDVSDRVHGEVERLREAQRENYLARYNAMGDMAMAIAHELGQPLAAAGNYLGGALARVSNGSADHGERVDLEGVTRGIESARRQIERASKIVEASRSFVGHLQHVAEPVDLHDVVAECEYFVRLRATAADIEVVVEPSASPVVVRCERVLTEQVVLNFCFNAIDEMAAAGTSGRTLRIVVRRGDGVGVVAVEDDGRGITRDPFADNFTSKDRGSGIGLALSYRIITRQRGSVWAERRDEGGSRFSFALPLAD